MARESDFLASLQKQLRILDDAAFHALASAGLLRRAKKDLETCSASHEVGHSDIKVLINEFEVKLDARGPSQARCSCPAKATCQHILAACLYLAALPYENSPEQEIPAGCTLSPSNSSLHDALLAFEFRELLEFAGKQAVRDALTIAKNDFPTIDKSGVVKITFNNPPLEIHYAGGGLEGFISDFKGRGRDKFIAAAVLSYQIAHGQEVIGFDESEEIQTTLFPEETEQARSILLSKTLTLLCDVVDVGLTHLSESFIERFSSLSIAAEGAKLRRLSLALARLADAIELQLEKNALSDSSAFLQSLAHTYALCSALRINENLLKVELVGEARTEYEKTTSLELVCAGSYPWETASGYTGITTLFWSESNRRWFSYSNSRPSGTIGFSPASAYREAGPWEGCANPASISGQEILFLRPAINKQGRISGASTTTAQVSSTSGYEKLLNAAFKNWSELREHLKMSTGFGLVETNPHQQYAVIIPTTFGEQLFDERTQELLWPLQDSKGALLVLKLSYSQLTHKAIERLEAIQSSEIRGIVVKGELNRSRLSATPLILMTNDRAIECFYLEDEPNKNAKKTLSQKLTAFLTAVKPTTAAPKIAETTATERMLTNLNLELLRLAERGVGQSADRFASLNSAVDKLAQAGLAVDFSVDKAKQLRGADRILRTCYASRVARDLIVAR